ncbi:PREDICTED: uncharacterized protein LOC106811333 [Priapulus caudatus]|uniref:Uncharacterized protein LOC106811333 n=1 Tax=Priapulus caudatus TaxID=37621 RepID=A0ABM1EDX9_PRICU|nr:PREDICTED: uncharacterized protein LOC106811333 [Priapulus caudatus]
MTLKELLNTTFGPRGDCGRTAHGAPPAAGLVQGYALPGRHGVTAADGSGFVSQEVGECSRRLPATAGNHHARHYLQSGDAAWHYSGGDALAGVHFPQRVPALYGAHQGFTPAPEAAPWSSHYQQNAAAHGELQAPVNQHLKLFNVDQAAFPVYASVGGQPAFGAVQRPSVTGYVTSAPLNMSIGSLAGVEIYATSQCDSHIANLSAHEELKPMIEKNEIFKPRRRREVKQKNEPKAKKRERKPETWKRNISKLRKARGEAYENSRGVLVPAVKPPSAEKVCKCNNLQCCEVPLAQKAALFNEFHSKTYNEQQAMIAALVDVRDVKRRYRKGALYREAAASRRQRTPLYYLWNSVGERVRVCMGTVCDALGISRVRLQALYRKKAAGLPIEDQRGKHANRPRRTKRGGGGATNVGSGSPWPSLDRGRTGSPPLPPQSKDVAAKERLTLQELLHYRSSSNIQQSVRCGRSRAVKSGVLAAAPHSEVERKDCGEASAIDAFTERASDEMMLSELLSSTFEPPN